MRFVASFDAKAFSDRELWKSCLAGDGTGLNFPYAVIIEILAKTYNRRIQ